MEGLTIQRAADSADVGGLRSRYRMFGAFRLLLAAAVVVSHSWNLRPDREEYFLSTIGLGNVAVMGFFVLPGT